MLLVLLYFLLEMYFILGWINITFFASSRIEFTISFPPEIFFKKVKFHGTISNDPDMNEWFLWYCTIAVWFPTSLWNGINPRMLSDRGITWWNKSTKFLKASLLKVTFQQTEHWLGIFGPYSNAHPDSSKIYCFYLLIYDIFVQNRPHWRKSILDQEASRRVELFIFTGVRDGRGATLLLQFLNPVISSAQQGIEPFAWCQTILSSFRSIT